MNVGGEMTKKDPPPQEITLKLDYKEKDQERKNCKAASLEISLML